MEINASGGGMREEEEGEGGGRRKGGGAKEERERRMRKGRRRRSLLVTCFKRSSETCISYMYNLVWKIQQRGPTGKAGNVRTAHNTLTPVAWLLNSSVHQHVGIGRTGGNICSKNTSSDVSLIKQRLFQIFLPTWHTWRSSSHVFWHHCHQRSVQCLLR